MNILIIGEYSGFSKHLKNGLKQIGHSVTIVMRPDSFKKFKGDDEDILYGYNLSILGKPIRGTALLLSPLRAILLRKKLNNKYRVLIPDLVIVVNYEFLTTSWFRVGTPLSFLNNLLIRGSKLIMSVCGLDPAFYSEYPEFYIRAGVKPMFDNERFSFLVTHSDAIIPTAFDYYRAITNYCERNGFNTAKISKIIPLPITVSNSYVIDSIKGRKIVIFHGIIRPKAKGTVYIKSAMDRLQEELPDRVLCVCKGGMPYDEYVKLFESIDILVDQTYGNGWGMNAAIGAMKGKCVLVPCGHENMENMGIEHIPFVQIGPDSEQIYQTLRDLVLNPQKIDRIKKESRRFIVEHCEASHIAKRYLNSVGM